MIKIDQIAAKQNMKKITISIFLVSLFITVYTMLFGMVSYTVANKPRGRRFTLIVYAIMSCICLTVISIEGYTVIDFLRPYGSFYKNLFLIDPARILIALFSGTWLLFFGKLLNEGTADWVLQEKQKELDAMLPAGNFNFLNRFHMLLFGSTGAGKGVFLNHIIRYNIEKGNFLVYISAKLAGTDKYNQLAYCRKMGKRYGRPVILVSMNEDETDREQYNPFKYIGEQELMNALDCMIKVDSHFYSSNFVAWVLAIYNAIQARGNTVSLQNILALYSYKDFHNYISKLKGADSCIDNTIKKLFSDKVRTYASVASKDSASFDLVYRAGKCVFDPTPNGKKVTLREAIKKNAIIYFDLNGNSAAAATMMTGCCIMAELQHLMKEFADPEVHKTVICDEASFYMSPMLKSAFNVSRSAGYQYIVATQGPSDLQAVQSENAQQLMSQLTNNANQFGILRLNNTSDAEFAASIIGTTYITENTRRAQGIEYDGMGSIKPVPAMIANPNLIKNLDACEMVYLEKKNDRTHEPHPVLIQWSVDDL